MWMIKEKGNWLVTMNTVEKYSLKLITQMIKEKGN